MHEKPRMRGEQGLDCGNFVKLRNRESGKRAETGLIENPRLVAAD
jgi:hypothetical protein